MVLYVGGNKNVYDKKTGNKIKKSRLLLAAAGIAVVLFAFYAAEAAFSTSEEQQRQELEQTVALLYEEQVETFREQPDKTIEHSITIELEKIGQNIATQLLKEDCSEIENIHIKVENTAALQEEENDTTIFADGKPVSSKMLQSLSDIMEEITNFEKISPFLDDLQGEQPEVTITKENNVTTKTVRYATYEWIIQTKANANKTEYKIWTEQNGHIYSVEGTASIKKQKLSGSFILTVSKSSRNILFEIEELDLNKWKKGYIKGTLVVPAQEIAWEKNTFWKEWTGYSLCDTEWIFSMNSEEKERRMKLTAILPEEVAGAVSIVTEVIE